jgi:uncharacterized membrane protein
LRYISIDVLRGLAILLMVQVHFVENLSSRIDADSWLDGLSITLGWIPAPLFTLISGASYALWLRKQEAADRKDRDITWITLRRGAFLFVAGIVFNVLVWLPEGTFNWDILTLIGTSLVLLAFARKLPHGVIALICVVVLLVSPLLRIATDYSGDWEDGDYVYDFTFEDVTCGFFVNGYFPLFPWVIFPLMGFVVGDALFARPGRAARFPRWTTVLGIALVSLAVVGFLCRGMPGRFGKFHLTGFSMFPATTLYVLGALGSSMIGLIALHQWIDRNASVTGTGGFLKFFRLFSTYSLTVYFLHHMAHLWPLWLYGYWMHKDPMRNWRIAVSTPMALALAVVFVVLCWFLLKFLDRHGKYGCESLMRRVCDYR